MALPAHLLAAIKGAKAKHGRTSNKIKKLAEGKTKIRILVANDILNQDLGVHWIKAEASGKPVAVVGCYDHTYDKTCPICTAIDKALKSTRDDDTLKLYKDWGARKEVLVWALIRSGPDASETEPVVLSLTSTTFSQIISIVEEYADEFGNVLDPDTGLDLVVERAGKGLETKYSVMPAPKSTPVPKGILAKCGDLGELIEAEYFGKETKGLNAICEISGITPAIGLATRAALTGPKAAIEDAVIEEEKPAPRAKAKPAPIVEEEVEEVVEAPPVKVKPGVAKAAAAKVAPKVEPAAAAPVDADEDDIDSILNSLDDL